MKRTPEGGVCRKTSRSFFNWIGARIAKEIKINDRTAGGILRPHPQLRSPPVSTIAGCSDTGHYNFKDQ